jgi:hypothetical protein
VAFPAMAGVHMLIGIGEGVITALVLAAVAKARPELVAPPFASAGGAGVPLASSGSSSGGSSGGGVVPGRESFAGLVFFGLLISLGLALFVSPFACPWPDGLEKKAELLGFKHMESATRALPAPAPEYRIPGIASEGVATAIAGAAGTVFVFGLAWGLSRVLVPKTKPQPPAQ